MQIARPLELLRENLLSVSPRADGNYNGGDFLWALDRAIEQAQAEDHAQDINKPADA